MHHWGDEGVDWAGIDDAAAFIAKRLLRWRVDVRQYKEKYGTVRVYCSLGVRMFHQLWWPGYVYNQYRWHWLWRLDLKLRWVWSWPNRLVIAPLHCWIYRRAYQDAVLRWPHLREEILCCADWPELLEEAVPRPGWSILLRFPRK